MGGKGKKGKKKGMGKRMADSELVDASSSFEIDGADEATRQSMKKVAGKTLELDPKVGSGKKKKQEPGLAGAGDKLLALMDQPMRKAPAKSAAQLHVGVKNGASCTVEQTDTDSNGVHRMRVTFEDRKGREHTGWVRQNDRAHRYFQLVESFAGAGDGGGGALTGHGNRLCWDGATVTARKTIMTRKLPASKANHAFKLKAGEQGLCNGTAVTHGVEYGRVVGPLGRRRQHTGWIEMKVGVVDVEGGSAGMGKVDAGVNGETAVGGAAIAEGVPPKGQKTAQKKVPPKKMSKKERKAWEKAEKERQERANQERLAEQRRNDRAIEAERARKEAEMNAAVEAEKAARMEQLVALGKEQMQQEQFAEAQGTFVTAISLQPTDQMSDALDSLLSEASDCREGAELAAEAELFIEIERPKIAVQRLEDALSNVADYPILVDRYTKALSDAREAVVQMEAREKAEEEELERRHEEELRQQEEERLFEQMDEVRARAKQEIERAHSRRECRDVANLVQKTLALDPDKKFKKRSELQTIAQRAIKKARAFKIADAAGTLLEDGFFEDAVEKYQEALDLDPVNPVIIEASDTAVGMLETQRKHAAQHDKEAEQAKIERKKKKVQLLVQQANAQIEEAEYYAAAATLESALAGRKYLDDGEVDLLQQMASKAEKQAEAKQLCLQGYDLVLSGKAKSGLAQYARAIEIDPDNGRWPTERDAAIADRKAKEDAEAAAATAAKSERKERKSAEKAAKQAAKRDKQVAKMTKNAGIQLDSKKYKICSRTCSQALGMIENDHPQYEELVELQEQADGILNIIDMNARAMELISTKDFAGAKTLLEEAIAVAPSGYPVETLEQVLSQTTDSLAQQEADREAQMAQAELRKQEELTRAKQAEADQAAAAIADTEVKAIEVALTPVRAGPVSTMSTVTKAQPTRDSDTGLGTFMCDNDINVKGTVLLGKVTSDIDLLISAFGNPKDTMLAGIDWHLMGTFNGKNLIAQVSGTDGSSEWSVKGMRGSDALGFVEAIIEQTQTDMKQSHVPLDTTTGLDSFRVDNELNIKMMRQVGVVGGTYNTMRYTFGPPKSERDSRNLVQWRLIGLHQGSWIPVVIRQPTMHQIEDAELILEWQILGISTSANDWAQQLLRSQHAHMNWEKGSIATSFVQGIAGVPDIVDEC